ncbi:MAG: Lrp/AsnC family transcriptional regulator [Verrucomicrobiota bacterium]
MMTIPVEHNEEINAQILEVSEDQIQGFVENPIECIAEKSGLPVDTVVERLRAMLEAGTIRRIRQTLMSVNLAPGALVAWKCPVDKLDKAFNFMYEQDPFSGHIVIRSTDIASAGSDYKLWTTLKVPQGYTMDDHCALLMEKTGATHYKLMPAKGVFALGVGHVRRKGMELGAKTEDKAVMMPTSVVELNEEEWKVLLGLKRELKPHEVTTNLWQQRAKEVDVPFARFCEVARSLNERRVIGRFSTFLEHVKPSNTGQRVTRFNGLFHWSVPQERVMEAGSEIGRHHILTHCYWREGGEEFKNVNVMAVCHGTEKKRVLEHKAAIDKHLESIAMPVYYTNVFWGGRSEIKPSEIHPKVYAEWLTRMKG